ncbi:RNA-binding protein 7 isoform X1 [Amblyraja radiata]|uniref:RNA-binding protein 7 isoform X1 n=1 Tax=Amblyraja radiata TaxID=386614 RepID=UPI001402E0B4|nr:RNA-binding protein 7 isoform X1 [Amblyraja radiata]
MGVSDDANKTLFIGNLDIKVTEELLFELFLQAGPLLAVKIPRDKDGKSKLFAFVNFKHEESVHYGKDLLNGIQLYGRAIKVQFRSGSSHESREGSQSQNSNASPGPYQTSNASPGPYQTSQFNNNRFATAQNVQRSFSTPDNLQRQVMVNNMWQQHARGGPQTCSSSVQQPSTNNRSNQQQTNRGMPSSSQMAPQNLANPNSHTAWNLEKISGTQRQQAYSSYPSDNGHYPREARFQDHNPDWHYRGNRESEYRQDQTSHHSRNWEHEYNAQREVSRGGRWRGNRQ